MRVPLNRRAALLVVFLFSIATVAALWYLGVVTIASVEYVPERWRSTYSMRTQVLSLASWVRHTALGGRSGPTVGMIAPGYLRCIDFDPAIACVHSYRGQIALGVFRAVNRGTLGTWGFRFQSFHVSHSIVRPPTELFRFRLSTEDARFMASKETSVLSLGLPAWAGLIVFASYPVILLMRGPLRCHRRLRAGKCTVCDYDLRGIGSTVCPECGTAIVRPSRANSV
jgi:hypothetical protein